MTSMRTVKEPLMPSLDATNLPETVLRQSYRYLDEPELIESGRAIQRRHQAKPHSQTNRLCVNRRKTKFVCKQLPGAPSSADPLAHWQGVFAFTNKLRRHGVSICLPALTRCRQAAACVHGAAPNTRTYWSLTPYCAHVAFAATPQQVDGLARTLALAHDAAGRWRAAPKYLVQGNLFRANKALVAASAQELQDKGHIKCDDEAEWQTFATDIYERLDFLEAQALAAGYESRKIAIHGDFHPGNALFARQPPSTVSQPRLIDFDCARIDDPLDDVVRAILHLEIFDLRKSLPSAEAIQRGRAKAVEFVGKYYQYRSAPAQAAATDGLWSAIFEAIAWQIVVLYFLKRLALVPADLERAKQTVSSLMHDIAPFAAPSKFVDQQGAEC
ncbi:MAG: hypothetical protein EOO40_00900 [Deltaproteobacteria bacterium]|nr:MAG: hypothetical protein EOO40_00900 [Deltaproteobacteria bacterium]